MLMPHLKFDLITMWLLVGSSGDTADKVMLWMVFQGEKALGVPAGKAGPLSAVARQGSAKFELLCTEMPRGSQGQLLGTCH